MRLLLAARTFGLLRWRPGFSRDANPAAFLRSGEFERAERYDPSPEALGIRLRPGRKFPETRWGMRKKVASLASLAPLRTSEPHRVSSNAGIVDPPRGLCDNP